MSKTRDILRVVGAQVGEEINSFAKCCLSFQYMLVVSIGVRVRGRIRYRREGERERGGREREIDGKEHLDQGYSGQITDYSGNKSMIVTVSERERERKRGGGGGGFIDCL